MFSVIFSDRLGKDVTTLVLVMQRLGDFSHDSADSKRSIVLDGLPPCIKSDLHSVCYSLSSLAAPLNTNFDQSSADGY